MQYAKSEILLYGSWLAFASDVCLSLAWLLLFDDKITAEKVHKMERAFMQMKLNIHWLDCIALQCINGNSLWVLRVWPSKLPKLLKTRLVFLLGQRSVFSDSHIWRRVSVMHTCEYEKQHKINTNFEQCSKKWAIATNILILIQRLNINTIRNIPSKWRDFTLHFEFCFHASRELLRLFPFLNFQGWL